MNETTKFETILLVDDDPVTNLVHRSMIERAGLAQAVMYATDAAQALEVLRAKQTSGQRLPDLILLDTNMPRGGGGAFLEGFATLDLSPNVPQIVGMVSAALLPIERARITDDPNVSAVCPRPLSDAILMKVVKAAWERCQPSGVAKADRLLS